MVVCCVLRSRNLAQRSRSTSEIVLQSSPSTAPALCFEMDEGSIGDPPGQLWVQAAQEAGSVGEKWAGRGEEDLSSIKYFTLRRKNEAAFAAPKKETPA